MLGVEYQEQGRSYAWYNAVPACLQTAKHELISYMGAVIDAFPAFGPEEDKMTVRSLIDRSETHCDSFTAELEEIKKCAPFCIP